RVDEGHDQREVRLAGPIEQNPAEDGESGSLRGTAGSNHDRTADQPHSSFFDKIAHETRGNDELRERKAALAELQEAPANAPDLVLARLAPGNDRRLAGFSIGENIDDQPALVGADRIDRAVERKPLEAVLRFDLA